ncbi:hypothetical protein [Paraburkholderia saeva]|uniref:hypothetical protein n=1 Tax=Paraburkholderia saeva TaxID=2777537 RepID=UPI001E4D1749|nr:hypothetical protein [Paraburkholderia saeva]
MKQMEAVDTELLERAVKLPAIHLEVALIPACKKRRVLSDIRKSVIVNLHGANHLGIAGDEKPALQAVKALTDRWVGE